MSLGTAVGYYAYTYYQQKKEKQQAISVNATQTPKQPQGATTPKQTTTPVQTQPVPQTVVENQKPPKPPVDLKKLEKPGIYIDLGTFIVNLADKDVQRYLKVSIVISVLNQKVQQQVQQFLPAIKDAIIDLISSKYYRDIRTPEGRERLKIEILKRINAILPDGGVMAVYFTTFIVQTM
ncbi:MAG: hypothetical protein GXN97_04830 [Aquificae bacterium]|nr:hypothetical protein [Aquificota bacterium]